MNASPGLQSVESAWVPLESCTLPAVAQPLRVAEFDRLFAEALTGVQRPRSNHLRLVLAGTPGLPRRVQDLAGRETGCCSFFQFTVTTLTDDPAAALVDIRVPANRADVLTALADRAEAHLPDSQRGQTK